MGLKWDEHGRQLFAVSNAHVHVQRRHLRRADRLRAYLTEDPTWGLAVLSLALFLALVVTGRA